MDILRVYAKIVYKKRRINEAPENKGEFVILCGIPQKKLPMPLLTRSKIKVRVSS